MFGMDTPELAVIVVIALIVLGPEKLPKIVRGLGQSVAQRRKLLDDLPDEMGRPLRLLIAATILVITVNGLLVALRGALK